MFVDDERRKHLEDGKRVGKDSLGNTNCLENKSVGKDSLEDSSLEDSSLEYTYYEENMKYCLYINRILSMADILHLKVDGTTLSLKFEEDNFILFTAAQSTSAVLEIFRDNQAIQTLKIELPRGGSGIKDVEEVGGANLSLFYASALKNNFLNNSSMSSIIGHRGSGKKNIYETRKMIEDRGESAYYENSVASFNSALKKGAQWVELDVQLTSDRIPVIVHDFVLREKGPVGEIKAKDFLEYFKNEDSRHNHLPSTLESIFPKIDAEMGLNVEIKYPSQEETEKYNLKRSIPLDEYVEEILAVLKKQPERRMIFSSFHPLVALYLRLRLPQSLVFFIISHDGTSKHSVSVERAVGFCSQGDLDGLVLDYLSIQKNPQDIKRKCKEAGLSLFVYGKETEDRKIVGDLLEIGVDGVITDNI